MSARATGRPIAYRALAAQVRNELAKGVYRDGKRLPTEAELCEIHGVSRQTVRRAMQDLVAEAAVYRVPGRGTFAAGSDGQYIRRLGSVDDLLALSIDTEMEVVVPLHRRVDIGVASRLRLDSDHLYQIAFRRLHRGEPICYTTTYLPPVVGEQLLEVSELVTVGATTSSTIIGLIEARTPGTIATADQSITVGCLPEDAGRAIGIPAGEPVLRIDRLYLDGKDQPVELALNWYNPAMYTYRVKLRRG